MFRANQPISKQLEPVALPRRVAWQAVRTFGWAAASLALFAGLWWLYSRNNGFDMMLHPDEPSKVQQILSGDYRNFNHPQLLLEGTQQALQWLVGYQPTPEQVVVAGRTVSAGYAALAVVTLAWAGYAIAGSWGWAMAAAFCGLCPLLLANAHYMKEEASLMLGVGLTTLGLAWFWTARRWFSILPAALLLGIGAGVAVSGKYVGVSAVPVAVLAVLAKRQWRWVPLVASPYLLLAGLVLAVGLINHRVWEQPEAVREAIDRELISATERHFGVTMNRPNGYFASAVWVEMLGPVRVLAVAFGVMLLVNWRRRGFDWLLLLLAAAFLVPVSYSIVPFHRYVLPTVVLAYFAAAITAARLTQAGGSRLAGAVLGLVLLGVYLEQAVPRAFDYTRQFAQDSRLRLREWANALPRGTQIVQDSYARLDHWSGGGLPGVQVFDPQWAGSLGDLPELRRRGIDYVVLCEFSYNRFVTPYTFGEPGFEQEFDRLRGFYRNLLDNHQPVWESVPKYNMNAMSNPVVKVYRVPPADGPGQ